MRTVYCERGNLDSNDYYRCCECGRAFVFAEFVDWYCVGPVWHVSDQHVPMQSKWANKTYSSLDHALRAAIQVPCHG